MQTLNLMLHPELKNDLPEKIIQFGEGNFLRCFIGWMIDRLNKKNIFNGRIVAVQPTPHGRVIGKLNAQDGLYTTVLRGVQNGATVNEKEIITSVSRGINPYTDWQKVLKCAEDPAIEYVFSNTTEAGLSYNNEDKAEMTPPQSFPGKLTLYLYHRYRYYNGAADKGMYIIPCELLEDNGILLKKLIMKYARQWNLPASFCEWLNEHNKFYNTLVDRVVSGYPKDEAEEFNKELGYADELLVCGEPFHFFAIEGDDCLKEKLPLQKVGLNVAVESDITKYRQRKVRLLNGGHTANVPAAFLAGLDTVAEMMQDKTAGRFACHTIREIILPSVDMDKKMLEDFAEAVIERFQNPFIKHYLLSILLNSTSKFKIRVLPSLLDYHRKFGEFPQELLFAFAAYIFVYKPVRVDKNHLYGLRDGIEYELTDDEENIIKLDAAWKLYNGTPEGAEATAAAVIEDVVLWDADLAELNIVQSVGAYLYRLDKEGSRSVMESLL
ncbi:tagaturonate reductase [Pectinatus haikarae]|uniref:Mannitol-1-phosphate/altronate dehydrogenase n=1 Tax=Pectinatus haikarae TaxID=349096 RepID=A0ABT9Y4I7_9FIRM|nr:tagaturonate reductase [Pectinatus haikarae]MDQ0202746.1 mannitol-1-phosphate/altronate dehydrogenase [Pectinatus haikarae]